MNKQTILLTIGASSSGKTTWANEIQSKYPDHWKSFNRDDYRFDLFTNGVHDWSLYKFTKARERAVSEAIIEDVKTALEEGKSVIISDTNLKPQIRDSWKSFAKTHECNYEEKVFDVDWDTLVERSQTRSNGVSMKVLRDQYLMMLIFLERERYIPNKDLPKAVIVDIDGTVADMTAIRGPFEWDKVCRDEPRTEILSMVKGMQMIGYSVVFLSGRDGVAYKDTMNWLKLHTDYPFELHMRAAGDSRKDYVVKEELFWPLTERFNITTAVDDRPQVLRLWEELGIKNIVNVSGSLYNEF